MGPNEEAPYDTRSTEEQAVSHAWWGRAIEQRLQSLDLVSEFQAEAQSYVVLDDDGNIVRHDYGGQIVGHIWRGAGRARNLASSHAGPPA